MKRKVNKVGTGTLIVSLPINWVKKNQIKKGDEINVDEKEDQLILQKGDNIKDKKSKIIEINKKSILRTSIGGAYRAGNDEITIQSKEKLTLTEVNNALNTLIGVEIKSFEPNKVVLKNIVSSNTEEYNFFINKIFVTINTMINFIQEGISGNEFNFEDIDSMRNNNLKSREFCTRAMDSLDYSELKKQSVYTFFIGFEKISGSLWNLGQYLNNHQKIKNKDLNKLLDEILIKIKQIHHVYNKHEFDEALQELLDYRQDMRTDWFKGDKLLNLFKENDPVILALILHIRRLIDSCASRLLTIISD